jgi:hypothetical protein
MTKTARAPRPTATALRAEQARLEQERPRVAAVVEVRAIGGRKDVNHRAAGPLRGIGIEYNGTVTGLPGIATTDAAALRLAAIDERLAEIDADMPTAEHREQEAQLRAQQADERQREQRVRDAIEATRAEVAKVQAARDAEAEARAHLGSTIAASPLGAVLGTRQAAQAARNDVAHAVARAGDAEAQARVLEALGDDACRALPGHHPASRPPAERKPQEYDWLIDALLDLPRLRQVVADLSIATHTRR